nr:hypothetical protein [Tanacetum cinerariifolium]
RAAKAKYWKLPVCYDDDDDEERSDSLDDNIISGLPPFSAITPDEPILSTEEPDNSLITPSEPIDSLSMGDEHLDTISATELDEFIKSCVENLVSTPNFSEKTFSNPLFEEEISSIKKNQHHFNAESDLVFMEEIDLFLTPDDPMPPSIEDDEDSEGDIIFLERLIHDDPIPLPDTLDFSYEVRVSLPFFTYLVTSPVLLSSRNSYQRILSSKS